MLLHPQTSAFVLIWIFLKWFRHVRNATPIQTLMPKRAVVLAPTSDTNVSLQSAFKHRNISFHNLPSSFVSSSDQVNLPVTSLISWISNCQSQAKAWHLGLQKNKCLVKQYSIQVRVDLQCQIWPSISEEDFKFGLKHQMCRTAEKCKYNTYKNTDSQKHYQERWDR